MVERKEAKYFFCIRKGTRRVFAIPQLEGGRNLPSPGFLTNKVWRYPRIGLLLAAWAL